MIPTVYVSMSITALEGMSLNVPLDTLQSRRLSESLESLAEHISAANDSEIAIVTSTLSSTESQHQASHLTYRGSNVPSQETDDDIRTNLMFQNETSDDFPDGGARAWLVVVGCFIGMIAVFGIPNAMGAIEAYVNTHQLQNVLHSSVSWVFSTNLAIQCFGGVFFGELFDRYGSTWPIVAATCLTVSGLLLTAELTTVYQFVLLFGILTGLGNGLALVSLLGAVSHWFLRKRGAALSIGTVGGLVGGTVFTLILQKMYISLGYKWSMRVLLLFCLVCMVIGNILVRERSQKPVIRKKFEFLPYIKGVLDFTIVKDLKFVALTLASSLAEIIAMTILTYLASYALGMGISNSRAYLILTVVNVCGIPSRFLSGILADKYGRFNTMIVSSSLSTIAIFSLWLPLNQSFGLLMSFAVVFGISSSSVISLIPVCAGQICSADRFGKVYGTLYFFMAFFVLLGTYVSSVIIGDATPKDFKNFILFEGGLGMTSMVVWVYARYTAVGFRWCKF